MWNFIWKRIVLVPKVRVRFTKRWIIQQRRFGQKTRQNVFFYNYGRQQSWRLTRLDRRTRVWSEWAQSRRRAHCQAISLQRQVLLCLGISSLIVTNASLENVALKVPSKDEVDLQNGLASVKNAQFIHGSYEELMAQYIPKFSDKDREIVRHLNTILDDCNNYENEFWKGKIVCEIGSGTGVLAFSVLDKETQGYIGLDISPAFVYYLDNEFRKRKYNNRTTTRAIVGQNSGESLCLPDDLKNKLDIFIICDTYYHLDNSFHTLKEISSYLKPHGQLMIIESNEQENTVKVDLQLAGFDKSYSIMDGKLNDQFAYIFTKQE